MNKYLIILATLFLVSCLNLKAANNEVDSLKNSGLDIDKIIDWYLDKIEEVKEIDSIQLFYAVSNLADLYAKERRYEEAYKYVQQGFDLGEQLKLSHTSEFRELINDKASHLNNSGQVKSAERLISRFIDEGVDDWIYVKLCFFYAKSLEFLGDINLSQTYLEKALKISETIKNEKYIVRSLVRLSRSYLLANNYPGAKKLYDRIEDYSYLPRKDQLMVVKYNVAAVLELHGHYYKAISIFEEVVSFGFNEKLPRYVVMGLINKGACLREINQFDGAIVDFEFALSLDPNQELVYNNLGEVYLQLGLTDSATYYFEKALDVAGININNYHFTEEMKRDLFLFPYKEYIIIFLHDLGRGLIADGQLKNNNSSLEKSMAIFELLDEMINEIRFSTTEQQSHHFWRNEVKPIYDDAIEAAYLSNNFDKAFYFAEKSKAVLLLDDLIQNTSTEEGIIPDSLLDSEFALKQDIFNLEMSMINAQGVTMEDSINEAMLHKKLELNNLIKQIASISPKYVDTKYEPPIANISDLQKKLKKDELAISYIWTDQSIFRYAIDRENFAIKRLEVDSTFESNLDYLLISLKKTTSKKEALKTNNRVSKEMFDFLLSDLPEEKERLTIFPDGRLCFIPFEALVTSAENPMQPQFLIKDKIISYGFSINTNYVGQTSKHQSAIFAFAPNNYKAHLALQPLRFSDFEMEPIDLDHTQSFKDNEAIKANLLHNLSDKNLVHIYSHAAANDSMHPYPWIAAHDEMIYLPEIYNHTTHANLVILSACETNLGKEVKGEGVISLSRGFFHAGAKSVLASMWQVNDKSNSEIVHHFYAFLKKGNTKAEALRLSKLKYIKDNKLEGISPNYWAGLVYIGEDGNLSLSKGNPFRIWWLLLGGIFVIFGLSFLIKRSQS